ncbi:MULTISPECIES: autotransporter domain-containing protein [Paraburkholderia]|nr:MULTISPECIES: autotransporter domain-containing protein [Paraburkholderia]
MSATTLSLVSGVYVSGATSSHFSIGNNSASGVVIENSGYLGVLAAGIAVNTRVNSGGELVIADGATATGIVQNNGADLRLTTLSEVAGTYVSAGTSRTFSVNRGTASGVVVENGGYLGVLAGGSSLNTTINSGGTEDVRSAGTTIGANINSGGQQLIHYGASAVNATVNAGGVQTVSSGGYVIGTNVMSGGQQNLLSGAESVSTTLNSGASENVASGAISINTIIREGSTENVIVQGYASSSTVLGGGTLVVSSGGVLSNGAVSSGGTEMVLAGGSSTQTTVNDGGLQYVDGAPEGYAYAATINSGGTQEVATGGTAIGTLVNASAFQLVDKNGIAVSTTVYGTQIVSSGGYASATNVLAGGTTHLLAGGSSSDITVTSGQAIIDGVADHLQANASRIGGTGSVLGALELTPGSTLIADTPGTGLHVSGNVSFDTGSTYNVTLVKGGQVGVLTVTGNLTIASGTKMVVTAQDGAYSPGIIYTLVHYSGTETGSFVQPTSNLAYLTPVLTYQPGFVNMQLSANSTFSQTGFVLPGATVNESNVASALNRIYAGNGNVGNAITKQLLVASNPEASNALDQLSGDESAVSRQIAEDRVAQAQGVIADRMAAAGSDKPNGLWVSAAAEHDSTVANGSLGSTAWQDRSASLSIGYDHQIKPTTRVGAALIANNDVVDFTDRNANSYINGAQVAVYGAYTPEHTAVYLFGMAGVGYWNNGTSRTVTVGPLSGTAKASFDTLSEAVYGETGLNLQATLGTVQPYLGVRAAHYAQNGYRETGSDMFDLNVQNASDNMVSSVLGVRFTGNSGSLLNRPIQMQTSFAWEHRLTGTGRSVVAALSSNPDQSWKAFATPADRDVVRASLGASWQVSPRTTVYGNVNGEIGSHTEDYGVRVGVQWKW